MRTMRTYLLEAKSEVLKQMRLPAYAIPTLLLPLMFYSFFGIALNRNAGVSGVSVAKYLLATYGAWGVMGAALFGFGVSVAIERGMGWLEVKRATPMPLLAYFVSKIAAAMLAGVLIVLGMTAIGIAFGGVRIGAAQLLPLIAVLLASSICFASLGLAIGYFAGPNSAPAIVNVIYLPMSFLSGLWIPIIFLPKPVQMVAFLLPPFHAAQLALATIGAGRGGSPLVHVLMLAVSTIVFLAVAYLGYRRDEGKTYG